MKTIKPYRYSGKIRVNASKSHVQRLLALSLLSNSPSILKRHQSCEDNEACLSIIKQLGAEVSGIETLTIQPPVRKRKQSINLFVNESGLCLRMFAFITTIFAEKIILSGSGSLLKRPLTFLENALKNSGLTIKNSVFPFEFVGEIKGGSIQLDGSESSQMLTGLLLTTPLLPTDTIIFVSNLTSKPYIDLTIELMQEFGVIIENDHYKKLTIKGNQYYTGRELEIEGDWSGAANHIIGAAISGKIILSGLKKDSKQADKICLTIVKAFGAKITWDDGDLVIEKALNPKPIHVDLMDNPDLFPILAILACAATGTSIFTGTDRLLHKESNRLQTVEEMLSVFGVSYSRKENTIEIHGKGQVEGGLINTYNDHRIAMAATVAACISTKDIQLINPLCIGKSYPNFFSDLGL
jgi:3-phosphoshikimate 1-carboxyvinyltransferase